MFLDTLFISFQDVSLCSNGGHKPEGCVQNSWLNLADVILSWLPLWHLCRWPGPLPVQHREPPTHLKLLKECPLLTRAYSQYAERNSDTFPETHRSPGCGYLHLFVTVWVRLIHWLPVFTGLGPKKNGNFVKKESSQTKGRIWWLGNKLRRENHQLIFPRHVCFVFEHFFSCYVNGLIAFWHWVTIRRLPAKIKES